MAKWIRINPLQENDGGAYICSKCRIGNWNIDGTETECPFCGAYMRGYTLETTTNQLAKAESEDKYADSD